MEAVGEWGGLRLDETKQLRDVQAGYTYFRNGDVVTAKVTPCFENGKGALAAGLVGGVAFGTTELHVLRAGARLDPRFLFYVTLSHPFRQVGASEMYGAGGQKRVPEWFFRDFVAPLPPLPVQHRIVAFLDRKTASIDALIQKKECLIELLREKRQAIITQAVTKGLDPTVSMKDSGVEWIGPFPTHWELRRLKEVATRVVVGIAQAATHAYAESGIPLVRSTNMRPNRILLDDLLFIDKSFADQLRSKYIRPGDLLTVRTGNAGVTAVVPPELALSQCFTMLITTLRREHSAHFFSLQLNSEIGTSHFTREGWGTAQENISVPILQNTPVLVPPAGEQTTIVTMLEERLAGMDVLLQATERQKQLLQEYRQALISAAVTGQIDVTGEAA